MSDEQTSADEALADEWTTALEEQTPAGDVIDDSAAQAARFDELQPEGRGAKSGDVKIDSILDVPITISMEIGRSRINIRNLLQLNQGSVVELDRLAGEPMDVLVNGTLIAQGEVVVVNEKFGIRLTDIVSPADRVKKLSS